MQLRVKEADDELQVLFAEAYAPVVIPDADHDVMTAEEVRKTAYNFMINSDTSIVDTQHDRVKNGSYIVESFIAREGDPVYIAGAWVVGIYVPDRELWEQVKNKDYRGLSLDFSFEYELVEYEVDIPEVLEGFTSEDNGHRHKFYARFDETGRFLGGYTDTVLGHSHDILRGTCTEDANGHKHNFDYATILNSLGENILINGDT